MRRVLLLIVGFYMTAATAANGPTPAPTLPTPGYNVPLQVSPDGPVIYGFSDDAGPDETFFVVGAGLTPNVEAWGVGPGNPAGQLYQPKVQFCTGEYLAATLPERACDGPFVIWVKNEKGGSKPFVLNAPQPWWCGPDVATPGQAVRLFGRNLARRPDFARAFVYLAQSGKPGEWLAVEKSSKYSLTVRLPQKIVDGEYEIWVHAGVGGQYGWGGPVRLTVKSVSKSLFPNVKKISTGDGQAIQRALDEMGKTGGTVRLAAGTFLLDGTLRIPQRVTLEGAGCEATVLQLAHKPHVQFARLGLCGWNQSPQRIHTPGDMLEYDLRVPVDGVWQVWLRYATEMSPWGKKGMDGQTGLSVDGGEFVPLMNLPNTGSFGTYKWARSAIIPMKAGAHRLVWKNLKGGGLSLDAFVFAIDPQFQPSDTPFPKSADRVIVIQGESVVKMQSKEGTLPGGQNAVIWLCGDGATVRDLTVLGSPQANIGIAVQGLPVSDADGAERLEWVDGCCIERVRVADLEGKHAEICGVRLFNASHAVVRNCELWGRSPLYLSGVRQCEFSRNRLVSATRFGGNAEAAIQGRNDTIEQCIIEDNVVACPPGTEAGGPTQRRLIWISTGKGSITRNWIARNQGDRARYGGVAGTDQNVGETILFEACQRIAFYGAITGAGPCSVTLPATVPRTPDNRLGNVKRETLAHDAAGNETPFWPSQVDDGTGEPPLTEYYVTVLKGRGMGQTRRVVSRNDTTLILDRPWREPPEAGCLVVVSTLYHQNIVLGNHTPDGMTGVQLWIGCVENIVSGNIIERQRKPGLFLYSTCTTLASSMPRTWNRGIGPLNWNHIEGNRTDECSDGALVTSGDAPELPIEWPRAIGNVLRHNSFVKNRFNGVLITSRKKAEGEPSPSPSILGTIVEFNVVCDAMTAYRAASNVDATVFRRNHAYFWYPVSLSAEPPVAFYIENEKALVAIELNSVEGKTGTIDKGIIEVQKGERR